MGKWNRAGWDYYLVLTRCDGTGFIFITRGLFWKMEMSSIVEYPIQHHMEA